MILYGDRIVSDEEVCVSHLDRGYLFGDGVYEVFRVYRGRLFEKEAHLQRLLRSAREIKLPLPFAIEQIAEKLEQLTILANVREGTVYMQITRGAAPRTHAFPADAKSLLLAFCNEVKRPLPTIRSGIAVIARPDIRWLRCDIKSLNLLPNVLAKQEAAEHKADEVILHRGGLVTECSAANVMVVQDGMLRTHPANHLILHGVTRSVVLKLARNLGIAVREEAFTLDDLRQADEVFITGTTVEVTPVIQVDGLPAAGGRPGPLTQKLQEAFERAIG